MSSSKMSLDEATDISEVPFVTPTRQTRRSDPETPYSPAYEVKLPSTPEAKQIAREVTKYEDKVSLASRGLITPPRQIKKTRKGGRKHKSKKTRKTKRRHSRK